VSARNALPPAESSAKLSHEAMRIAQSGFFLSLAQR
jgi:hypothetical protein